MKKLGQAVMLLLAASGAVAMASDFNGDGTDDIGIFRPSVSFWAVRNVTTAYFGTYGDYPVPGDYNGDRRDEIAVFRSSAALWAIKDLTRAYYGQFGDAPIGGNGADALWSRGIGDHIYANVMPYQNVGIGTGTPSRKLHVYGINPRVLIEDSGSGNPEVNFKIPDPSYPDHWAIYMNGGSGGLKLWNGEDQVAVQYGTGNVDLGTGEHRAKLTVDGTVLLKGNSTFNSANGYAGLYCHSEELYAIDGAGNLTLLSPHASETGEWIFYSKNVKTGRVVQVDMERLVRKVEELTGEKFMVEKWEKAE